MKTYFVVSDDGMIKIGKSENPEHRLECLRTSNHRKLVLMGTLVGDFERQYHEKFKRSRIQGEWFIITVELFEFLKTNFPDRIDCIPTRVRLLYDTEFSRGQLLGQKLVREDHKNSLVDRRFVVSAESGDVDFNGRILERLDNNRYIVELLQAEIKSAESITINQQVRMWADQAAKSLRVSVKTLQRWDREKILVANRTGSGKRWYSGDQIEAFRHGKTSH